MLSSLYLGVDVGSTTTEALLLTEEEQVLRRVIRPTGSRPAETAETVIEEIVAGEKVAYIVSTGYGRKGVKLADRALTEITCLALGARAQNSTAAAVLDIGGQDSKFLWLTADGRPASFALNDRCAAGTGRFLELTAARIELPLKSWGEIDPTEAEGLSLSATCGVFAESELIGHLAAGVSPRRLAAAAAFSVSARVLPLMGQAGRAELPLDGGLALAGGVASNPLVAQTLSLTFSRRGLHARPLEYPSFTVALGAALAARKLAKNHTRSHD